MLITIRRSMNTLPAGAVVAALLLGATPVRAQGVGFGIIGGAIRSEVNSSGDESQNVVLEHRTAPTGGLFFTIPISDVFWIQPEALLSVKGTQWDLGNLEGQLRLTYLDVPVLFRFAGPSAAPVRIHLFGGPTAGVLLNASSELTRPTSTTIDVKDRYDNFDLGWVLGVGVGGSRWNLDLRYGGSVTAITDETELGGGAPAPETGLSPSFRNRAFQLLLGVRLF